MEFTVHRTKNTAKACTGWIELAGGHECYCLEDSIRRLGPNGEGKIYGATGIPAGRYQIIMNFSNRFQRIMPLLLRVPFFSGIRWHSGNTDADVSGCTAIGIEKLNDDYIRGGRIEAPIVYHKIQDAIDRGEEVWATYVDEFPDEDYQPGGEQSCS
jgi:hypothetical protein